MDSKMKAVYKPRGISNNHECKCNEEKWLPFFMMLGINDKIENLKMKIFKAHD